MAICKAEGCTSSQIKARGLCPDHYVPRRTQPCAVEGCDRIARSMKRGAMCSAHSSARDKGLEIRPGPPRKLHPRNIVCSVEGCSRHARALGLCRNHWDYNKSAGQTSCGVETCTRKPFCQGWCTAHYGRWRKTGDVQADKPLGPWSLRHGQVQREQIAALKTAAGCADCHEHFEDCPEVLEFDHLPWFEKKFTIAQKLGKFNWEAILAEIAKCEVVCANCHRRRTVRRRKATARAARHPWWTASPPSCS